MGEWRRFGRVAGTEPGLADPSASSVVDRSVLYATVEPANSRKSQGPILKPEAILKKSVLDQ